LGCDAVCYALTASPLADAIGVNCSLGPAQLLPVAEKILEFTDKPVIVQANAGLPDAAGNYNVSADEFARACEGFIEKGVRSSWAAAAAPRPNISANCERSRTLPNRSRRRSDAYPRCVRRESASSSTA